ncbi:MAG: Helix-turn-helix domain, partial [Actinomycetota bacterium]
MTLGEELKAARLEKNLSVEQLSTLSRVSVKNIQSFEADDFSTDAKVFVMANLSAIAKVLEIDISPKFESAPSVNPSPNVIDVLDREGEPLQRRNYTFVVMTIGLLLLFALI